MVDPVDPEGRRKGGAAGIDDTGSAEDDKAASDLAVVTGTGPSAA